MRGCRTGDGQGYGHRQRDSGQRHTCKSAATPVGGRPTPSQRCQRLPGVASIRVFNSARNSGCSRIVAADWRSSSASRSISRSSGSISGAVPPGRD